MALLALAQNLPQQTSFFAYFAIGEVGCDWSFCTIDNWIAPTNTLNTVGLSLMSHFAYEFSNMLSPSS